MTIFFSFLFLAPPRFTRSPVDQTGVSGGVASFICQATGDPRPKIVWNKKGKKVSNQRFEVLGPLFCSSVKDNACMEFCRLVPFVSISWYKESVIKALCSSLHLLADDDGSCCYITITEPIVTNYKWILMTKLNSSTLYCEQFQCMLGLCCLQNGSCMFPACCLL